GLALWSPYAISKSSDAIYAVQRKAKIINPYKSTNENNFFRGVGAVIVYDNFLISGFYSNNYFDANIDSLSNGILSTPIDGYHRTKNEIEKRKSAKEKLLGIRLDFIEPNNSLEAGFLYYNSKFSNSFIPNDIHDFRRDQFNCYSFYSNFYFDRMKVFGEAAYDGTSVASVLGTNIQISDNFSFITHIRNYPRNYRNIHAFAFGEKSGATKNEFGIYSGFQWSTSIGEINFYYDQFKFPYATFENPLPSAGDELLFNLRSKPIKKLESNLRVRYEKKEITRGVGIIESLVNSHKYSIRGEMTYEHSRSLRIKTRVEAVKVIVKKINADENGILIAQDVKLSPIKNLTFDARILFFQTDSFNSAIYTFENDLTGLLSSSALYGKGIRWYLLIKYGIANFLTLSAKYSETYKPLEKSLGTGLAEINTNIDNKIGIQLEISL
ncbi:MAG: hypothetical protein HXY50_00385, partial [Ignavibacteriaceae bacterium]|nr:hypothetical protein [Ignavibacteriaceae bacterium]